MYNAIYIFYLSKIPTKYQKIKLTKAATKHSFAIH